MAPVFSEVIWQEGENFAEAGKGIEQIIGLRPPASGGAALNGSALAVEGNTVKYRLVLEKNISSAKIIFRYARLHWRAGMKPAEFVCNISNAGNNYSTKLIFGDTQGWGTNNGREWGLFEAKLGDLSKGPAEITLSVSSKLGDATLDGFFLAPGDFKITTEELAGLNRIKIHDYGYAGLDLAYSAIEQNAFSGFNFVIREFGRKQWDLNAALLDEAGREVISFYRNAGLQVDGTLKIGLNSEGVKNLPDGAYRVAASWNAGKDKLEFPFTVLGNALEQADRKKKEYLEFIESYKKNGNEKYLSILEDLQYAVDYIENTIVLLRAKRGAGEESDRKRALAYFEKAKNRTARSFLTDLNKIIEQSSETIARLKNNTGAYTGRCGDLRRAFYSKATGKLEPYRLFVPASYASREKLPVLLALHGGGGDENYFPDLDDGEVLKIMEKTGMFMISPKATSWYKGDGAKDLVQLINLVLAEYPGADRSRVFSTGVSMGGYGSYNLAAEYPGLLAGIACVSGTVRNDYSKLENFKNTPCLIIHGGADSVVPVEEAIKTAEELKKQGCVYRLNIFPSYGHDYRAGEYMNLTLDFFEKYAGLKR